MSQELLDNFLAKKWGVFNHYLKPMQNGGLKDRNPSGRITDWNTCVNEFDTEKLAYNLHKMGAGYYMITVNQATKYMCAPNATFDKIIGAKPGEACSLRDLPADIHKSLSKYGIDLFLYMCSNGPWLEKELDGNVIFLDNPRRHVDDAFVENWAAVMQEYSERYGDKVKGWWIDSCYKSVGFNDEHLKIFHKALKSGNPDALIAFNVRGTTRYGRGCSLEEYVCGELNDFDKLPIDRYADGAQGHILAPLGILPDWAGGGAWAFPGCCRSKEHMLNYIRRANEIGVPVSVDIVVYRDGSFQDEQQELLTYVGHNL